MNIHCNKCDVDKDESEFSKRGAEMHRCRSCNAEIARDYRATPEGREASRRAQRDYYRRGKLEALMRYSNGTMACVCCGESTPEFLTIDHVNEDGADHRRETKDTNIGVVLKRAGWPEGYQVLCFNCNCGRARNGGVCPHQAPRLSIVGEDRL